MHRSELRSASGRPLRDCTAPPLHYFRPVIVFVIRLKSLQPLARSDEFDAKCQPVFQSSQRSPCGAGPQYKTNSSTECLERNFICCHDFPGQFFDLRILRLYSYILYIGFDLLVVCSSWLVAVMRASGIRRYHCQADSRIRCTISEFGCRICHNAAHSRVS